MNWDKVEIRTEKGIIVQAQAPIIISASRATDIPAFYSDWFFQKLKEGYVQWKNPFNGVQSYVSFLNTRLIIFWSKNPEPFLKYINSLEERIPNYYIHYTLNDYDFEKLEPNVPNVKYRIETFIKLSERIGKDKVIWRFDPLILTDKIGINELLRKIERIGDQLKNYTEKLVFSFADIGVYKKVQNNLRKNSILYEEFSENLMNEFASGLQQLNKSWNLELGTCAEKISLEEYGIIHNKCIDDDLIIKLFPHDRVLMEFLGVNLRPPDFFNPKFIIEKKKSNKDKGQRENCGCVFSKDIGMYNTCPHICEYCYANSSKEVAISNWNMYKPSPNSELIKGE